MINTNTWKHRKIRRSTRQHMAWMSAIISLHWGPTVWTPSIFPFLLPPTPQETTQSAWEQEHLSARVEMERTYECARVRAWMQDKEREESEQKKRRCSGTVHWEHVDVERARETARGEETDKMKRRLRGQRNKWDEDGEEEKEGCYPTKGSFILSNCSCP